MTRGNKSQIATRQLAAEVASRPVLVDRERYSEASKRSYGWNLLPSAYSDIRYLCKACGEADVWTRAEQKIDFEELGKYMWQTRVLCTNCFRKKVALQKTLRARQQRSTKRNLSEQEWKAWAEDLREYVKLGGRENPALARMIEKRIKEAPASRSNTTPCPAAGPR